MSQLVRSGDRFQSPNRRDFLQASAAGVAAAGALGMNDLCTLQAEELKRGGRAMILLWMQGGAEPDGDVRSQAGDEQRRTDHGD